VAYSDTLKNGANLTTAVNETLKVTVHDGTIYVNSAKVVTPNVLCKEGVVHVIDELRPLPLLTCIERTPWLNTFSVTEFSTPQIQL